MGKSRNDAYRVANPDWNRAMHALGSSSATQPHTPLPRKGSRMQRDRQAIRDQIREMD